MYDRGVAPPEGRAGTERGVPSTHQREARQAGGVEDSDRGVRPFGGSEPGRSSVKFDVPARWPAGGTGMERSPFKLPGAATATAVTPASPDPGRGQLLRQRLLHRPGPLLPLRRQAGLPRPADAMPQSRDLAGTVPGWQAELSGGQLRPARSGPGGAGTSDGHGRRRPRSVRSTLRPLAWIRLTRRGGHDAPLSHNDLSAYDQHSDKCVLGHPLRRTWGNWRTARNGTSSARPTECSTGPHGGVVRRSMGIRVGAASSCGRSPR